MTSQSGTIIFWGAGATASLGIRTTVQQGRFLRQLVDEQFGSSLHDRVQKALGGHSHDCWSSALVDLLAILGDDVLEHSSTAIAADTLNTMGRNWRYGADADELRDRVLALRGLYDWPALKEVIQLCPAWTGDDFNITDLFNILDMHGHSSHGFRTNKGEFLTPQRVQGARNALRMLLQTMFYIDYQRCLEDKPQELQTHYAFARALGRRMQRLGQERAGNASFDSRKYYLGDIGFASLNYDPIALWCQYVANRDLNKSASVPYVGQPGARLQIFHDLGHFVAGTRVVEKGNTKGIPWFPMNESAAQRLNDTDHGATDCIRISKFLFPHGCLCWRQCPDCGKLSSYLGDEWEWNSPTLIPPPPLKAFVKDGRYRSRRCNEHKAWENGEVDARACVHCGTLTYAHHTQTLMQSNFKSPPPPFIEEIKRDLRVAVQQADHIILMGYSLPPDDVDYRAFIASRRRRADNGNRPVRCSVVVGHQHSHLWCGPSELPSLLKYMKRGTTPRTTLEAARDLFGKEHVRFYGGGIPGVFTDGNGTVTDSAVERLLSWEGS